MTAPGFQHRFSFEAIGTSWRIDTSHELNASGRSAVLDVVDAYDAVYSRFRADSRISILSALPGPRTVVLPPSGEALGRIYRTLHRLTNGAMSPLVGGSLEQLGYDAGYSLRPAGPPVPAPVWDRTFRWERNVLHSEYPVTVDVGAAGKGQLVDLVSQTLQDLGHDEHVVDAGGDMVHRGAGIPVALEHPYTADSAIGVLTLSNRALCASASNRRRWADGLHHVVDATTGACVDTVVATWVLADDALHADALATALFFVPPEALLDEFDFEYVLVYSEGRARFSSSLAGALF